MANIEENKIVETTEIERPNDKQTYYITVNLEDKKFQEKLFLEKVTEL